MRPTTNSAEDADARQRWIERAPGQWQPVEHETIECDCGEGCGCSLTVEADGSITLENEAGYWSVWLPEDYAVCRKASDRR